MPEKKIKILHVLDSLGVGGMERVVLNVVNGLDPLIFEQAVCCISRKGESAKLLREGARCLDLGKGDEADHLMPFKIARVIREERPHLIHTQSWAGVDGIIAHLIARRTRSIHSEHGRNLPYIDGEPMRRRVARRCAFHLADMVFTVSEEMRQYLCHETGFPRERMLVIPNGVDIRRFDEACTPGLGEKLGIALQDFVIGTVARFDATKDLGMLIRAFAHLCGIRRDQSLKLLLVGDGSERSKLERLAVDLGLDERVVFTGFRQDIPQLLRIMHVFALPSLSEGLPVAVLEAMCASLPLVATNVGALSELVTDGENGFLVEPRSTEAMTERLSRLINDAELAHKFGAAGRRKVEQSYSLDLMLKRYGEMYLSLLQMC